MAKILTLEEAQKRLEERQVVTDVWFGDWDTYRTAVIFTDDHCLKNTYGFKTWVPCTTRLGVNQVKTMEDYIRHFEKDEKILWSEEEVIEFRNSLRDKPC
ncbi:MAG: hypothetical protein PHQ58_04405 [Rhodoferax sp.]|uniref:hypothetical protein n=1 Tax=Rhodoferax sp. TaxID=50421 RepID=UPI00262E2F33|nr:hypothetical protein [Rhodoferax sp.]MDD2879657.1 hypothetical protein [Rhodoferax sp.]